MPYLLDFSPLLGDSLDTTPNVVSTSIATSTETVAPLKNGSGDDLNSDDFNSDDIPTLEARITVSPAPDPTPAPAPAPASIPTFAPAPPTKPPLKSILKRKRQVEVTISSDNDDNRLDLDNGGKELLGDGNYRPRQRDNRGQFKKARIE
ncbi:hypothetical protein BGZ57DRAFT_858567 [Hyaloscypha finlandica]|nr:hypothetical protein BGZ57DRAFT_858567 [Hyaloscypha finlandica]